MSKAEEKHDAAVVDAAQHHSDLNVFHAILAILEGGVVYSQSGRVAAERIIKLCKEENQKQVRLYDNALRKAGVK
jgi:hypothetical protein